MEMNIEIQCTAEQLSQHTRRNPCYWGPPRPTALEEFLELLPNMFRQEAALRCKLRLERGKVFLNKLIQQGALRAVAHRRWCNDPRIGFPASW